MNFNDRFIVTTPSLANTNISSLSDEQLEALSPAVKEMADMVRTYSVLIKKRTAKEIYVLVTQQADPRIALILAAARDNAGLRLFPDLNSVKQIMFGPSDPSASSFINADRNIFVDGIKRICAALTASILIGQLAQIDEQAKHSLVIEAQALNDLDRLLKVPDLATAFQVPANPNEQDTKSFYFQPKDIELGSRVLKVEFYMPSGLTTGWQVSGNYTATFSTAEIAADLADAINSYTLTQNTSNIIAAPILGDQSQLYKIDFQARSRDSIVSCEVITVRIRFVDNPSEQIPFSWGVDISGINNRNVNSVLLSVQQGKASVVGVTSSTRETGEPTVLYFKRAPVNSTYEVLDYAGAIVPPSQWAIESPLTFRISPMMVANKTVPVPYITHTASNPSPPPVLVPDPVLQPKQDANRPSQVAEILLNEMFAIKGDTLSLGALIRNDNPDNINALVALELIAFSVTNPEAWMILDLLEIPKDILVAVGNLQAPLTPFSNKPRSIRVESKFYSEVAATKKVVTLDGGSTPRVVKTPVSDSLNRIRQHSSYSVTESNRSPDYRRYW